MTDKQPNIGKPLDLSDFALDILAEVTEDDIQRARALWRRTAPVEFRNLLDAEETEEGE
jgi:hypothetical protein